MTRTSIPSQAWKLSGNTKKNTGGASGKGFDVSGQPTPEQKKAGWERRRQAQEMMDKVREYMKMPQDKFIELLNDIKANPDKYTVEEVLLYKYATKAFNGDKFMLDWFDRNISKAPQQVEGSDGKEIIVKFINGNNTTESTPETGGGIIDAI